MAVTTFTPGDALTNKLWARRLHHEWISQTYFSSMIGGPNAIIELKDGPQKSAGDKITYGLRMVPTGRGVTGSNTLEGNEERSTYYNDSLIVNQLRHALRSRAPGSIDAQRVPYDLQKEDYDGILSWVAERMEVSIFNQLAGNTAETDTAYTGLQATIAPDAAHWILAGGVANDQSLASAHTFNLTLLDDAVRKARLLSPLIRPLKIGGKDYYVVFLHPNQVFDLRTDATTAGQWFDIQSTAMSGSAVEANPIFSGALGVYNQCILHESTRIPKGVDTSGTPVSRDNTRRAVLCGAQSACIAFGMDHGPYRFKYVDKSFDYDLEVGTSVSTIMGVKKTRFNSADYGSITISTYTSKEA